MCCPRSQITRSGTTRRSRAAERSRPRPKTSRASTDGACSRRRRRTDSRPKRHAARLLSASLRQRRCLSSHRWRARRRATSYLCTGCHASVGVALPLVVASGHAADRHSGHSVWTEASVLLSALCGAHRVPARESFAVSRAGPWNQARPVLAILGIRRSEQGCGEGRCGARCATLADLSV
jgi:hypothetical protein